MPELPEVETVVRGLKEVLIGKRILSVILLRKDVIRPPGAERFKKKLAGSTVTGCARRGKFIIIELNGAGCLQVHLRMTGVLIYCVNGEPCRPHTHVILQLDNGHQLRFADMRRFGYLRLIEGDITTVVASMSSLGPEPLTDLDLGAFRSKISKLRASRRPIKAWLIDQGWLAGIGNLYADEILFDAGIRPDRLPGSLTGAEVGRLFRSIQGILTAAIENRGTTFSDYVDLSGEEGGFFRHLKVYRRGGLTCLRCGRTISKTRISGRGTHYCSQCQA